MRQHKNFFLYCGLLMLASEIWKQWSLTFLLNRGHYNWWYFPFQLCSIPMYLCLLLPWINSKKARSILLTFLMDFGLLAGIFTFFDTSGLHYGYTPLTVHSYAWHILLIIIGICAGRTKEADYSLGGFLKSSSLYLVCCLIATIFNLAFYQFGQINMFYISPYYRMSQKVFEYITVRFGNPAAIISYISAILLGSGIFHLFWTFMNRNTARDKTHLPIQKGRNNKT